MEHLTKHRLWIVLYYRRSFSTMLATYLITENGAPPFFWSIKVQTYISEKDSQEDVSSFPRVHRLMCFATMGYYCRKQSTAIGFYFVLYCLPLESPFYLRILSFLRLCSITKRASGIDPGLSMWAISSKKLQLANEGKGLKGSQHSICRAQCPWGGQHNAVEILPGGHLILICTKTLCRLAKSLGLNSCCLTVNWGTVCQCV